MRLCHVDDVPDRHSRGFDPRGGGQDTVVVVRQGRALFAYADACPHHGTPMAWRKDAYLDAACERIVCAAHGALFEIATGLCILGPCLGEALKPVALTVYENGDVHLVETPFEEPHP
jgi:nitrite reductase/ring-hydroxylating ferredoxin subunit